ncbi:hypothetical protein [Flavobacterium sp. AJR]|uniref:hypothetical protein n=1 Tax=unclassified Flavobacterium TaxID=196869 RepID=UPI0013FD61EB|nr:hypothetical protein [Flavobacterium sp. AJR]
MKTKREKKEVNKFDLERFVIAKLKNPHLIKGGGNGTEGEPVTNPKFKKSTDYCK